VRYALLAAAALTLLVPATAQAWNCTTPGQIRVQVPNGTTGNGQGDGSGQVVTVEGLTFECEASPTTPTTPTSTPSTSAATSNSTSSANSASNSAANSASSSSANSNQSQKQQQNQTQNAIGGNAASSATATGGKAVATNNSSGNSTSISENENETYKAAASSAIAPAVLPTSPCFKGYSAAGQSASFGFSIGGGKIDVGCDERETARLLAAMGSRYSACKILVLEPSAKRAGVTMDDCMRVPPPAPVVVAAPAPPPQIIVNTPPVTITEPAITEPAITLEVVAEAPKPAPVNVVAAARANAAAHPTVHRKPPCKCVLDNDTIKK
jgi:hypothetical protein